MWHSPRRPPRSRTAGRGRLQRYFPHGPERCFPVPGEGFEPPTFGLQNRCSTPELTRLAGACALTAISVAAAPQAVVGARTHRRILRTWGGRRWPGPFRCAGAAAGRDQVTELTFSSTSISQAAACSTASRCASFSLRKVSLSRRQRAPVAGVAFRGVAERREARNQRVAVCFDLVVAPAETGARGRCRLDGGWGRSAGRHETINFIGVGWIGGLVGPVIMRRNPATSRPLPAARRLILPREWGRRRKAFV